MPGEPNEEATFETIDEAIAFALMDAPDGCVIAIHEADCKVEGDDESTCTCTPLELTTGAKS